MGRIIRLSVAHSLWAIDNFIFSNVTWMWHHQTHHRYQCQETILLNFSNDENDWNLFLKKMNDSIQARKDQNPYEIKGKFKKLYFYGNWRKSFYSENYDFESQLMIEVRSRIITRQKILLKKIFLQNPFRRSIWIFPRIQLTTKLEISQAWNQK